MHLRLGDFMYGLVLIRVTSALPAEDAKYYKFLNKRALSPDNTCGFVGAGNSNKYSCAATGATTGSCCSQSGYCGTTSDYCGSGCQSAFGICSGSDSISTSNTVCGPSNGNQVCSSGLCCSGSGYCGNTTGYCGAGCQSAYGSSCSTTVTNGGSETCGPAFNNANCPAGQCCSPSGYCGTTESYCADPNCQYMYGTCDSDTTPAGASTLTDPRPSLGNVSYTTDIYNCIEQNVVALTYDDGPYTYTSELLDVLASFGFHATFFVTGNNLGKGEIDTTAPYPSIIQRMVDEGHQVASHTWSHYSLSNITSAKRIQQMVKNERALANILGYYPTYMRPPYSQCDAPSGCQADMQSLGYHRVYFNLDTQDYVNPLPSQIQNSKNVVAAALSSNAVPEYLAIQHDIVQQSVTNLTSYFYGLIQAKGWKGVTAGECLQDPKANWYRTPGGSTATSSVFVSNATSSAVSSTITGFFNTTLLTASALTTTGATAINSTSMNSTTTKSVAISSMTISSMAIRSNTTSSTAASSTINTLSITNSTAIGSTTTTSSSSNSSIITSPTASILNTTILTMIRSTTASSTHPVSIVTSSTATISSSTSLTAGWSNTTSSTIVGSTATGSTSTKSIATGSSTTGLTTTTPTVTTMTTTGSTAIRSNLTILTLSFGTTFTITSPTSTQSFPGSASIGTNFTVSVSPSGIASSKSTLTTSTTTASITKPTSTTSTTLTISSTGTTTPTSVTPTTTSKPSTSISSKSGTTSSLTTTTTKITSTSSNVGSTIEASITSTTTGKATTTASSTSKPSTSSATSTTTGKTMTTVSTSSRISTTSTTSTTTSKTTTFPSTTSRSCTKSTTSTISTIPAASSTCIVTAGKFCGTILPFESIGGCQTSAADCYIQAVDCLSKAGVLNQTACLKYTEHCEELSAYCFTCRSSCSSAAFMKTTVV